MKANFLQREIPQDKLHLYIFYIDDKKKARLGHHVYTSYAFEKCPSRMRSFVDYRLTTNLGD